MERYNQVENRSKAKEYININKQLVELIKQNSFVFQLINDSIRQNEDDQLRADRKLDYNKKEIEALCNADAYNDQSRTPINLDDKRTQVQQQ